MISSPDPRNSAALLEAFRAAWRDPARPPDLRAFVERQGKLPPRVLADLVLIDQRCRWKTGTPFAVEDYLRQFPPLCENHELHGDLIYGEFRRRTEAGENPQIEAFAARFPAFEADLRRQLEVASWGDHEPHLTETDDRSTARDLRAFPRAFGPYDLLAVLGQGGTATVYRARHRELGREVALKVLRENLSSSTRLRTRFENEARAISRLNHPQIVPIYEIGDCREERYFTTKLYAQGSLAQRLGHFHGKWRAAAALVEKVARGVQYAHEHGVLHRDLKPQNVFLESDECPVVGDFGLAMSLTDGSDLTRTGEIIGTLNYLAPECLSGERSQIGIRTDVYGLGAILYQLLSGRCPFEGVGQVELLDSVRRRDPPAPQRLVPSVPADLDTICQKAMAKQPDQRYASASALADDLRCFLEGRSIAARPVGVGRQAARWIRLNPLPVATGAIVLVSLLSLVGVLAISNVREKTLNRQLQSALVESKAATTAAGDARVRAELAERDTRRQAQINEELLYAAQIHLASQHMQAGDHEQSQILLDRWIPKSGSADHRGLEWRLLKSQLTIPGEELLRLPGDVSCVRIAPNQKYLIAATDGGTVRRYEFASRRELTPWETNLVDVRRMEFSHDGDLLAVISYEAEVAVIDVATGAVRHRIARPEKGTANPDVAFSPKSQLLVATGRGPIVEVLDTAPGAQPLPWEAWQEKILDIAFGRHLDLLAMATDNSGQFSRITIYDEPTGRQFTYFYLTFAPSALALSPNSDYVAVGGDQGEVEVWDWSVPKKISGLQLSEKISELNFSADGQFLAFAERTGMVHVWRWRDAFLSPPESTPRPAAKDMPEAPRQAGAFHWQAHPRPARSAIFAPEERQVITAGIDGRIMRWTLHQPAERRIAGSIPGESELTWLGGSNRLAMRRSNSLAVLDAGTGAAVAEFPSLRVSKIAGSSDGEWLAWSNGANETYFWNVDRVGAPTRLSDCDGSPVRSYYLPNSTNLVVVTEVPHCRIECWDVESNRRLFRRDLDRVGPGAYTTPHGGRTLFVVTDRSIHEVDLQTGDERREWSFEGRDTYCLAAAPDGNLLAVGGKDRQIELVDLETGQVRRTLVGHLGRINQLHFTPDGKTLLSLDERGLLKFWQVAHGSELMAWPSQEPVNAFQLSPNGRWLALGRVHDIEIVEIGRTD